MTLSTGQVLENRYRIVSLLGQGGMGAVFRGRDIRTGQTVAVKELRHDLTDLDPQALDRFRREAETLRRLDHPSIVKLLDSVEEDGRQYLCLLYTSPSPRDGLLSRMPSSA